MVSLYFCFRKHDSTNIQNTDEKICALLELYNIPFTVDMFLHDKKLAYLRFVGASQALTHLVLD